jgi:hypothetical protein
MMTLSSALFSRPSVAYKSDGSQVAAGVPRYETGHAGQGIVVEEQTIPIISTSDQARCKSGWYAANDSGHVTWTQDAVGEKITGVVNTTISVEAYVEIQYNASYYQGKTIAFAVDVDVSGQTASMPSLFLYDQQSGGFAYTTMSFPSQNYVGRLSIMRTLRNPCDNNLTSGRLRVRLNAGINAGTTIIIRKASCEEKIYSTSWHDPADGTRQPEALFFDPAYIITPTTGMISMWVYMGSRIKKNGTGTSELLYHATSGDENRISLGRDNTTNKWYAKTGNAAGALSTSEKADALADGWHWIGMRWSSSELCVLVDGVKGTLVSSPNLPSTLAALAYIGYSSNTVLDDFSVWRRSITDQEISDYYNGVPLAGSPDYYLSFNGSLAPAGVIIPSDRRVFTLDRDRRDFMLDRDRRIFILDRERRILR